MEILKKGFEYNTVFDGVTLILEATPKDANADEQKVKQFCVVIIRQSGIKGFKNFRKVLSVQELKELLGFKKKEKIQWD